MLHALTVVTVMALVHATHHLATMFAHLREMRTMAGQNTLEHIEALLLAVIQALVKRRLSIGESLEVFACPGQSVGLTPQTRDRIGRAGFILPSRRHAFLTRLRDVAQCGLEGGPVIFLLRRESQPGFQRGDAGIGESGLVFL
jgi:hypothetical protein